MYLSSICRIDLNFKTASYKLCPDRVFLPVNMQLYKEVSSNVMEILRGFSEKFKQVSVDEAYLVPIDIMSFDDSILCAQRIKDEVQYFANFHLA
jgi:DNA polymerase IV (archaeal DinB-like DNA polymerase)